MNQSHGMNKNEALNMLDLDLGASKETILSKTRELAQKYETSEDPADHAKLADIYAATQTLLGEEERRIHSRRLKKKVMKIGLVAGIALILVTLVSVFSVVSINRKNTYGDLSAMMKNVSIANYEDIGDTLNDLPDNYEDVATFKDQYASIRSNIEVIETNNVFDESDTMREAYYALEAIDEETEQWDLSYYLGRVDTRVLLLGMGWENSEHYFDLHREPNTEIGYILQTSLPKAQEPDKDYYFYSRYNMTLFGYMNIEDRTDIFEAYEIMSIDGDALRIYAVESDETYTLYPENS